MQSSALPTTSLQTTTMCDTPGERGCVSVQSATMCDTPGERDCVTSQPAPMCDNTPGESGCLASQTTSSNNLTTSSNNLTIALTSGISGGIAIAIFIVLVVLCVLVSLSRKKKVPIATNTTSAYELNRPHDGSQKGYTNALGSENAYDYIDSEKAYDLIDSVSHPSCTSTVYNVSYNVCMNEVVITEANEAYGGVNGNPIYATVDEVESEMRKDQVSEAKLCELL